MMRIIAIVVALGVIGGQVAPLGEELAGAPDLPET